MGNLEPQDEANISFVQEYDRKIHSFVWRVDADKANIAFLDEWNSPLNTVGTKLQRAMEKYRATWRNIQSFVMDEEDLIEPAYTARFWIEKALDRGIIVQGDGLTGKLEEANKTIKKLQDEKTSLENQLIIVSKKNEKLEKEKKTYKKIKAIQENIK